MRTMMKTYFLLLNTEMANSSSLVAWRDENRDEDAKTEEILYNTEYRNGKFIKFGGVDRNFLKRAEMAQKRLEEFEKSLNARLEAK